MSYLSDLLGDAYKENMTEDEISEALQSVRDKRTAETDKLKTALSKANSEAANYKKQLRDKQTDDEASEAARKEEMDKLLSENAELKRSIALSQITAKLLANGYDEALANETAVAMADGDTDKILASQSKYLEAQKKSMMAEKMRDTPRPAAGKEDNSKTVSRTDLKKMSMAERFKYSQEHTDEYKAMYSQSDSTE